ncbi:MAG: UDP-glucose 4-epimerase GalE [Caulobacteraceae bacterium]
MSRVLVTGGAGYIGSHAVLALLEAGYGPLVVDDLSTGRADAVPAEVPFISGDAGDRRLIEQVLARYEIEAVMHFAASIVVPESVADPVKYYANNTSVTLSLLERCLEHAVPRFIFSSSAAVYGIPQTPRVSEGSPTNPISPYGASKLFSERMLLDAAAAHPGFRPVCLRYFNVAGADPLGRAGQSGPESTHLIRAALETALDARPHLDIFGTDYETRDGTGERDYIHVSDLAAAHVAALRYLEAGGSPTVLNCGYGTGFTVFEVVAAVERLIGRRLPVRVAPRREGDPACLVADPGELRRRLDWRPQHADLAEMISTAMAWMKSRRSPEPSLPAAGA